MHYKGVIFDLDGTLVDSLEDIADSMNTVLKSQSLPTHDYPAYQSFIGNGLRNLVRLALPEGSPESLIDQNFNWMMQEYRKNCVNKTHPYAGINEMLKELSAQGMKLAVLTNKVHELAEKVMDVLFPEAHFEIILGVSPEFPRKPDSTGALFISKKLDIPPENFLYLGDSDVDMKTANRAGMVAVGALWGYRSQEVLTSSGAKHLVYHPLELIKLLNE